MSELLKEDSMYIILAIGALIAIINVVLTYQELIPFFKALKQLNEFTTKNPSVLNRAAYLPRFITLIPKLIPLAIDATIALVCGGIGLGGGVFGALIGITIGFTASLLVKVHRRYISPKIKCDNSTWKFAESK